MQGRLGDLGCIPEEYDVAVSTACPNLDNVVVENAKAGQRCVNFLKSEAPIFSQCHFFSPSFCVATVL